MSYSLREHRARCADINHHEALLSLYAGVLKPGGNNTGNLLEMQLWVEVCSGQKGFMVVEIEPAQPPKAGAQARLIRLNKE